MNDDSSDADGEMIAMTIESLMQIGLTEFKVDIGHAGVFRGLVEEAGLSDDEIEQLKIYLSNKNIFAVEDMLEDKDIPKGCKELMAQLPDLFGGLSTIEFAKEKTQNPQALEALERLEILYHILESYGLEEHITFDLGMLSHYEYYTGIIFKAYTYGTGAAIVTGGRYDNLVEQFGKKTAAIGLAFVLDELMIALDRQGVKIPIVNDEILILYRSANRKKAIELARKLRADEQPVRLMRKYAENPLEIYKDYAVRAEVKTILYIDDTGEITEFEV